MSKARHERMAGGGVHEGEHMKMGGQMGEKHHGRKSQLHRESGGAIGDDDRKVKEESYSGTGSETEKEAERKKRGGPVHKGRMPMHVDGKAPSHARLDRPGRKRGGAVGADSKPMTSAHNLTPPAGMKNSYGISGKENYAMPMSAKTDSSDD